MEFFENDEYLFEEDSDVVLVRSMNVIDVELFYLLIEQILKVDDVCKSKCVSLFFIVLLVVSIFCFIGYFI